MARVTSEPQQWLQPLCPLLNYFPWVQPFNAESLRLSVKQNLNILSCENKLKNKQRLSTNSVLIWSSELSPVLSAWCEVCLHVIMWEPLSRLFIATVLYQLSAVVAVVCPLLHFSLSCFPDSEQEGIRSSSLPSINTSLQPWFVSSFKAFMNWLAWQLYFYTWKFPD